jgi:aryl-alcohol dehydrogenase-like predicted oxidoreductase
MAVEKRRLGKTEIEITPIGQGCWQFGGRGGMGWIVWRSPPQDEADKIVKTALEGGINWFDTAEAYGSGHSEKMLSTALSNAGKVDGDVVIATKWKPFFRTASSISSTIGDRQRYLAPFSIDLHQVHFPSSFSSVEAEMDAMAALVKEGKIRSVGVSNFKVEQMRRAHAALAKHGLPLASNQVRFNLAARNKEKEGVLDAARELGVTIIAYSPLAQGLLTGKFHKNPELIKKLPIFRRFAIGRMVEKSRPLIKMLEDIAGSYNCTASEVALSWVVNYFGDTIVAIPGASKTEHALQNVGAMNLKLTQDELTKLDELSRTIAL